MTENIANFDQVTHLYDNYRALDNVSFSLPEKGVVGLLGLNGAGKTTTMSLLCGVITPTQGRILVDNHSIKLNPKRCKALIGYAPDRPPLYPECTTTEYLYYVAALRRVSKNSRGKAVERAIESTNITDYAHKLCGNLSHGYRQRLNLAQAIIHSPPLIVLDEPTSGLDPVQIELARKLIKELSQTSCVLISTHLLFEAQQLCDRVLVVHNSRIFEEQTVTDDAEDATVEYNLTFAELPLIDDPKELFDFSAQFKACEVIQEAKTANGVVKLTMESGSGARQKLLKFILDNGLDLVGMRRHHIDLETRFLSMTGSLPDSEMENPKDDVDSSADNDETTTKATSEEKARPEEESQAPSARAGEQTNDK